MQKRAHELQAGDRVETGDGFFDVVGLVDDGEAQFEVVLSGEGGTILMARDSLLDAKDDGTFVIFPSEL